MDAANRFDSTTTYRLIRLEYLVGLVVTLYLLIANLGEIRWWAFVLLFVYIDVVGYLPGAIAFHRSGNARISKTYYVLYNVMHSMATQFGVALVWTATHGFEWALLALPLHLCGDRALFGNFLKPFRLPFEPVAHPAFVQLAADVDAPRRGSVTASTEQVLAS